MEQQILKKILAAITVMLWIATIWIIACADPGVDELDCGHGYQTGDTCKCDDGYDFDKDDQTCKKGDDDDDDDDDEDCGDHGEMHNGHCHCDKGYLFNGEECVEPDEIDEECEEEEDERTLYGSDDDDDDDDDNDHSEDESEDEHEHEEAACRCPETGACPCDHGEIVEHGADKFCVPEEEED